VVTLCFAYGCPRIHKIVQGILFTINLESKENVGTGMLTEEEKTIKECLYGVKIISVNGTKPNVIGHVDSAAGCFVTIGNLLSCQKLLLVIFINSLLHAVGIGSLDSYAPL
jgi:hypothetical protein